jgi:hypothetical protein
LNNGGAWDKTHESAWFLEMTHTMLVKARGRELWLAPFITDQWLKPGARLTVRHAPSYLGPVSYELAADERGVSATIQPPDRADCQALVLRLRDPAGRRIRQVAVDGAAHEDFDPRSGRVRVKPDGRELRVRVEY